MTDQKPMSDQSPDQDMNQDAPADNQDSYVDAYNPPQNQDQPGNSGSGQPADQSSSTPAASDNGDSSEKLEDQNIFFLLGVTDGSEEEREAFLDELQQVIWEDFLENDVELLITEEELDDLKKITGATGKSDEEMQEEVIVFLEKLIPDLEEIMLEKALELKEDMVRERILGMKEYYAGDDESLKVLDEAQSLVDQAKWKTAAERMNTLVA